MGGVDDPDATLPLDEGRSSKPAPPIWSVCIMPWASLYFL
jgi:hypothetical protein